MTSRRGAFSPESIRGLQSGNSFETEGVLPTPGNSFETEGVLPTPLPPLFEVVSRHNAPARYDYIRNRTDSRAERWEKMYRQ